MNKSIKVLIITLAIIIPSIIAILIYNDKITQNSPVYYKQGTEFYNKGDYQNAYYNYVKINKISPLYQMALFKQAKSAQKINDYNTAVLKYELFLKNNEDSIFADSARFNLAKCHYYLKNYETAKQLFEKSKSIKGKNTSIEDYFLGLINKSSDKDEAISNFVNYLDVNSSNDRNYELSAAEEITTMGKQLDDKDNILVGQAYYRNKKYSKALEYFSKVPQEKCFDYLVLSNHYAGNKIIAKKLIEQGLFIYTANISDDNLHKIYDIYTSYFMGNKLKNWTMLLKVVQTKSLKGEDYVLYKLAQYSPKEKALSYYSEINEKFPNSDYAPEAVWNIFWDKYTKQDYYGAMEIATGHLKSFPNAISTPRIAYWLAKTELNLNKTAEAHNVLNRLISKYPDDYYGLRAEYLLNNNNAFWEITPSKKLPYEKQIEFPITISNLDIKDLKLINSLFEMGDYDIWLDANFDNKIVESWFELRKDKKARSIVLARDEIKDMKVKPSTLSAAYKLAYPLHYVEDINIAAEKTGVPAYYIISIIKEESHFDTNAKSSTNATGLMQVLPSTANYIASVLNAPIETLASLSDVKTNIYIGSNYLKYLCTKFDNNYLFVTAAYNGGEGSVSKWIKTYNTEDYDEFIENIPFDETRNYIRKIFRTYHMYKKIYQ